MMSTSLSIEPLVGARQHAATPSAHAPRTSYEALNLCVQVQHGAAEQIDASLESLLRGLMTLASAVGASWRLVDETQPGRPIELASMVLGELSGERDGNTVAFVKSVRPGRVMTFTLRLPTADCRPAATPMEAVHLILDALGRWMHWLDMSHGPLNAQGPMPPHQRKVLLLLVTGLSEKQIAAHLGISTNTAHQYVSALFRRYGVRNRPSLMAHWLGSLPNSITEPHRDGVRAN